MTRDLRPLFEPRGVVVAGASTHPGKFGFVSLHNILTSGYRGRLYGLAREQGEVLGVPVLADAADLPADEIDLVFVCTPPAVNEQLIRDVAARGVRAVFMAAGGYSEAGDEGRAAEDRLVALCDELGLILAGPNGQGVVSPPVDLCAQIVAPYPPRGRIAIASQSGNFVSSFQNYAAQTGIGVSRAISAGNAGQLGIVDYLDWFADDDETAVSLIYVEGIDDGRQFYERAAAVAARKPIVVLKGGASAGGQRAAASHTGALATDDAVFDGMCRQAGLMRARNVEDAFEAAATFATQPIPPGNRVAVLTSVGGWGVLTADAMADTDLVLTELPDDLRAALDAELPPR
ncbi:MAG: CoA-binding protein, partial [Acidimicrobiia bacterium]|nr:CoA-binding protein [Acidimicrobiia bacterium]